MDVKKGELWYLCAGVSSGRSPDSMNGLLVSAGSDCRTAGMVEKTKDFIKNTKPEHVTLDSGGYQIHLAEKRGVPMTFSPDEPTRITKNCFNLPPRHVVESSVEIGANSMIALDFPIRKIKDPYEQEKEFRKKLPYNVSWAIETAELREALCPHIGLFIPVQAYNLKQLEEFYQKICHIKFDGLSLPVRNMTMVDLAVFLLKIHKWGIKRVHILGSSSLPNMSVCAYMSQSFFDWVSFDATSWRIAAQFGQFVHPHDLSSKKLSKAGSYDLQYKCHCISCKERSLEQIATMERKERMGTLLTHNYLAIRNLCRKFSEAAFDYRFLEKHLRKSNRKDVKKILRCMSDIEKMCSPHTTKTIDKKAWINPVHSFRRYI